MTEAELFSNRSEKHGFAKTLNQIIGSSNRDYPDKKIKTYPGLQKGTPFFAPWREHGKKHDDLPSDAVHIDTRMLHLMENNVAYKNTTEKLLQQMTIITRAMGEGGK